MNLRPLLFVVAGIGLALSARADGPQAFLGKRLPAFSMVDLEGQRVTNDSLKGHIAVIDFWAGWCTTCHLISPVLEDLHKKYGSKVAIIGADVYENRKGVAAAYKRKHRYTFRFTENNDAFARSLDILGLPGVIVVDKRGVLRKFYPGYSTALKGDLDRLIEQLSKA